jgi:4'-phosphopantetheinyl transferase EntD
VVSAPVDAASARRDPWIGALFGPEVATASLALDAADPGALLPAEAALAAGFAPRRRQEFAAGRQCARALLAALGADSGPLLPGPQRAPLWPPGVVGSISHGAGLCVAALAWRGRILGLGVDVESDAPLGHAVRARLLSGAEQSLLDGAAEPAAGRLGKLLFCAKEATYKCVHPLLGGSSLGLRSFAIELDPGAMRFRTRALPAVGEKARPLLARVEGAIALAAGRVLVGATLRGGES